jgi:hypothetical protein
MSVDPPRPAAAGTELVAGAAIAGLAWFVDFLPIVCWGAIGGVCRWLILPPDEATFRRLMLISVRSSLVGLVVGLTIEQWELAGEVVPSGVRPLAVWFTGFGSVTILGVATRTWEWVDSNADPGAVLRWLLRRGGPGPRPPNEG